MNYLLNLTVVGFSDESTPYLCFWHVWLIPSFTGDRDRVRFGYNFH